MRKFRIERTRGDRYKVQVKQWIGWGSGFVHTNFFEIDYGTLVAAEKAIEDYKNRFTEDK